MKEIRLKEVHEMADVPGMGLIVLVDEQEKRQLSIPCDSASVWQLNMRMQSEKPIEGLLPEVLMSVIHASNAGSTPKIDLIIKDIQDGVFQCEYWFDGQHFYKDADGTTKTRGTPLVFCSGKIRASDAVLLSLISDTPIRVNDDLWFRQSSPYMPNAGGVALPISSMSLPMLEKSLSKAIAEERYELAGILRDEIRHRKSKS